MKNEIKYLKKEVILMKNKSINIIFQALNTKDYKSILDMQRGTTKCSSKRLNKLYDKKKRVITYILHKSTKMIIDYCINNDITRVIIGDITNIRKYRNAYFAFSK